MSPQQTLEAPGVSVVIDHNKWSPIFFDEKNAGIQIIYQDFAPFRQMRSGEGDTAVELLLRRRRHVRRRKMKEGDAFAR